MLKPFLYTLLFLLLFNFAYKGYNYFKYNKTTGKVVGHEWVSYRYKVKQRHSDKYVERKESTESPVVEFNIDNEQYTMAVTRWGYIDFLDDGDEVTVLYKGEDCQINTLFQYWITFYDIMIGIFLCIFCPVIFEIGKYIKVQLADME